MFSVTWVLNALLNRGISLLITYPNFHLTDVLLSFPKAGYFTTVVVAVADPVMAIVHRINRVAQGSVSNPRIHGLPFNV